MERYGKGGVMRSMYGKGSVRYGVATAKDHIGNIVY